jgi:hypothetical protein
MSPERLWPAIAAAWFLVPAFPSPEAPGPLTAEEVAQRLALMHRVLWSTGTRDER